MAGWVWMIRTARPAAIARFSVQPVAAATIPKAPTIAVPSTGLARDRAADDDVGHEASVPVGRVRPAAPVAWLPVMASRLTTASPTAIDVRVGGALVFVDEDAAALTEFEPGGFRQPGLGAHPDGRNHQRGGQPVAVGEGHRVAADLGDGRRR